MRIKLLFHNKKWILALGLISTFFTGVGQIMRIVIAANPIELIDIFKISIHTLWGGLLSTAIFIIVEKFTTDDDKTTSGKEDNSIDGFKRTSFSRKSMLHNFVTSFLLITIAALPMLIIYYPGMLLTDAYIEIQYASGMQEWIAHFSVPMDIFLYKLVSCGRQILGNDNAAFFLYTGLQFIAQTAVFSYTYAFICKINSLRFVHISTLAFFALNTVIRIWGYTMGKDTIYAVALLLLIVIVLDIDWHKKNVTDAAKNHGTEECSCKTLSSSTHNITGKSCRKKERFWHLFAVLSIFGASFLVAILRKNGIYVLIIWAVIGFLTSRTQKWRYVTIIGAVLTSILVNNWFINHYDVKPGYVREALSVPIQQTARYVKYYGNEMTTDEKSAISSVFNISFDEISMLYDPEASDNVKFFFSENPSVEDLKCYFHTWWKMFLKHPGCYISAFVSNTYAYFDLTKVSNFGGTLGVYDIGEAYDWSGKLNYNFSHNPNFEEARTFIKNLHNLVAKIPIIGIFSCCGIYTFLLMFEFMYVIKRKHYGDIVILLPSFLSLCFCFLSPVNGLMRYMLPIMMCTPINISWCGRNSKYNDTPRID